MATFSGEIVSYESDPEPNYGVTFYSSGVESLVSDPTPNFGTFMCSERTSYMTVIPEGGITMQVVNKVWDSAVGGGQWVPWETASRDFSGSSYPYPSNWGISTSNYRVQSIIYIGGA